MIEPLEISSKSYYLRGVVVHDTDQFTEGTDPLCHISFNIITEL